MSLRDEIEQKRNVLLPIAGRHGATNLRLFGSVARGKSTIRSIWRTSPTTCAERPAVRQCPRTTDWGMPTRLAGAIAVPDAGG